MPIPVIVWVVVEIGGAVAARVIVRQVAKTVVKKVVETGVKQVAKEGVKQVAKEGTKQVAKKVTQTATKVAKNKGKPTTGNTGVRSHKGNTSKGKKKGPCDHLKQGSGKGPYRGGAHSKTSKPKNDGKDSHHMPADDVSPLKRGNGPAIQMDPADHRRTSSNGNQGLKGVQYRKKIEGLLQQKKWREAMLTEIKDVRKIAAKAGTPRKYNEAMLEMLEYFKCLEKNKLLK